MFPQKAGRGLGQLVFQLGAVGSVPLGDEEDAAHQVPFGDHRGGHGHPVLAVALGHGQLIAAGVAVGGAGVHDLRQLGTDGLFQQLPPGAAGDSDDAVPVTDGGDAVGGFAQAVADLGGKIPQLPDGGIFLENQLPILIGENLQRVAFTDAHGAADLFGDDHAA